MIQIKVTRCNLKYCLGMCLRKLFEYVHLELRSYCFRIFAHGVVGADAAVVACLTTCHRNQSSCQDQTEHLVSGTDKIGKVTKFHKIYEPLLSSRCQKCDIQQVPY
jgi:hypothetical protein